MGFNIGKAIKKGMKSAGKGIGTVVGGAMGMGADKAAEQALKFGKRSEASAREQEALAAGQYKAMGEGAATQGAAYDQAVAQRLGETPEQYMARLQAGSGQFADQEALATTRGATKQAVRGARTAGMMGGQAALAAAQQAGDVYAGARQAAGTEGRAIYGGQDTQRINSQMNMAGQMAARQQASAAGQTNLAGQNLNAATSGFTGNIQGKTAAGQQAGNMVSGAMGAAAMMSDVRMKDDIEPVSLADALEKIKGYSFKYKGEERPEVGVMAQDLEGTALEPAVIQSPDGIKGIDAKRLTTANTAALSEHEKRIREIETILAAVGGAK